MTVSSSVGRELNVAQVVLRAHNLAGLSPVEAGATGVMWDRRKAAALDFLQIILDELQTEGVFARSVSFTNLQLVAGTYIYDMPDTVFDVIEDGAYISPDETDITKAAAETPVLQKDRETWQMQSAKNASSRPTLFFTDRRMTPIQVRLWPVPNEAGTIRFQTHRLLSDVTDTNATVDIERFWTAFLIYELGGTLAIAANKVEHGQGLLAMAAQKKDRAKAQSNQHTPSQIVLEHATGWNK